MAYDYLKSGVGKPPMRFAEDFEVRYPLVSIGHWPPMYYAVQAAFFLLAEPSIRSAEVLNALTSAALAVLLFVSVRRDVDVSLATAGVACFLAAPLIQLAAWQVMSDLLTGLFVFLALLAFTRLLEKNGDWKAAAGFALWSIAAILTKGSAWALAPFVLLAPLLARRVQFFRGRWFLGALLAMMLCGTAFYVAAAKLGIGYPTRLGHYLTEGLAERATLWKQVFVFAPWLLQVLGLLGAADAVHARWCRNDDSRWTTLTLVMAAWCASQILFLITLPMTPEPRVLMPALAPLAVLSIRAFQQIERGIRNRWPRNLVWSGVIPLMLAALVVVKCGSAAAIGSRGYREAADAMEYTPNGALILIATSYENGEGQIIAERLSHDRRHKDVILRGSHVLSEIDSAGRDFPRFHTPAEVKAYLLQMPVQYIVLGQPPYNFAFQPIIDEAVSGDPSDFHLMTTVKTRQPDGQAGELRIYENPAARDHHPSVVSTPGGYDAGRRVLEYQWK